MQTLYLNEHGLQIKKKSNRLIVKKEGKIVEEVALGELKRVLIFGNSQVTTEAMRLLSKNAVEVAFLSAHGRFHYRLVPETSKNIFLRLAQHERSRDHSFKMQFCRNLVRAKIRNQRTLLVRYRRNQPHADINSHLSALKASLEDIDRQDDIARLMGIEGQAARTYFSGYGKLLRGDFKMSGRQYRPAPDPVNAMLSFGYTLILHEIQGLLEACGFDVFLAFLHSVKYGRASLAMDMQEEFRAPVIDRLVLYLVNRKIVSPNDFKKKGKGGVWLKEKPRKRFLTNYDRFMTASFQDPVSRMKKTFRGLLREQVLQLENTLIHNSHYQPFNFPS